MLKTMRSLPRSFFITAALGVLVVAAFACGGGGGGGDDSETPTPPTVTLTSPLDNSYQIHPDSDIVITFSTAMDTATVHAAINFSPATTITFSPADWNPGMTVLTITPDNNLAENTAYTVTIGTGAQDSVGTALASAYSLDFTTGDVPLVSDSQPYPSGATGVSPDDWVGFGFSEPMSTASVEENLNVVPSATYSTRWEEGNSVLILDFSPALAASTSYTVTIGAASTDLEGTAMGTAEVLSFTTENRPTITLTSPSNNAVNVSTGAEFKITFSESMGSSAQEATIVPGYGGAISSYLESSSTVVRLFFGSGLLDNAVYTVQVGATAENSNGTHLDGSYEFVFSTGPTLTGQTVSGTVSDAAGAVPGAEVKLLTRNSAVSDWQYDFAKLAVTDGSGNYTMSLVQDDTYWPAAVKDTNGDNLTHLQFGDAFGIANSITVSGSSVPNTDITIHDPEAISGSILYNGAYASTITGAADNMGLYAFMGTDLITGAIYLSNDIESGTNLLLNTILEVCEAKV